MREKHPEEQHPEEQHPEEQHPEEQQLEDVKKAQSQLTGGKTFQASTLANAFQPMILALQKKVVKME